MVGSWEVYMEWTDRIKLSFAGEVGLKRSGVAERAPSGMGGGVPGLEGDTRVMGAGRVRGWEIL